jgi:uncharacterized protein
MDIHATSWVTDPDELRARFGEPMDKGLMMHVPFLHEHHALFISRSPYVLVATVAADGLPTVSPKGDAPGFVKTIDAKTLVIPDRPGNNQIVNLLNITRNPGVGLCFLIPGIREVLRVVGTGKVTLDPGVLNFVAAGDKPAMAAIVVEVKDCFIHCGKNIVRAKLWEKDYMSGYDVIPTIGANMIAIQNLDMPPNAIDEFAEEYYSTTLY